MMGLLTGASKQNQPFFSRRDRNWCSSRCSNFWGKERRVAVKVKTPSSLAKLKIVGSSNSRSSIGPLHAALLYNPHEEESAACPYSVRAGKSEASVTSFPHSPNNSEVSGASWSQPFGSIL